MIVAMEGNLSARLGDKTMVITRRGRRKGELSMRDFVEMTFDASEDSPERRQVEAAGILVGDDGMRFSL